MPFNFELPFPPSPLHTEFPPPFYLSSLRPVPSFFRYFSFRVFSLTFIAVAPCHLGTTSPNFPLSRPAFCNPSSFSMRGIYADPCLHIISCLLFRLSLFTALLLPPPYLLLNGHCHEIIRVCYHCGGLSEEVNSCILILSYMVYL